MGDEFGVYEWAVGIFWNVNPSTREHAEEECALMGAGYTVETAVDGAALSNAFAFGRHKGHDEAKERGIK